MAYAAVSVNSTAASSWAPASRYMKRLKNDSSRRKDFRCEVGSGGGGRRRAAAASWAGDYDLYSLLGVERTSEVGEIRKAYRALQKRCHPDIAGPAGHDMAILLNQIYSFLSDPASREAYDRERSKLSDFREYTGKPIYSRWLGHQAEQRAVFVDEVKCIGCLKCALHANKTFAIESVYGRARVVAQWADSEDKIFDAIKTCPVDCISIVERSDLAALEFLMSKQPRGNVMMTGGNNVGVRVANVFEEVKKFQRKFDEMNAKASTKNSQEADLQRNSRTQAMDAIRSISSWLYWQKFSSAETRLSLAATSRRQLPPNTEKLREAAAKLKAEAAVGFSHWPTASHEQKEEYWAPLLILPTPSSSSNSSSDSCKPEPQTRSTKDKKKEAIDTEIKSHSSANPIIFGIPISMAVVSAAVIGSKGRGSSFGDGLQEHIGGSWALEVVNSFELQVILAENSRASPAHHQCATANHGEQSMHHLRTIGAPLAHAARRPTPPVAPPTCSTRRPAYRHCLTCRTTATTPPTTFVAMPTSIFFVATPTLTPSIASSTDAASLPANLRCPLPRQPTMHVNVLAFKPCFVHGEWTYLIIIATSFED